MDIPKNFSSWKIVILSFFAAAVFWFFSALGEEYNYRINHPIKFIYDKDSLIAIKPLPQFVDLDVSGLGWNLFKEFFWFGADPVTFELENPAAIHYLTTPTILPVLTEQLNEYRINFLFTDTLYIDIDRKTFKKINLQLDSLAISMEEDYRIVTPIKISPDTSIIFGPKSFLDTFSRCYTIPLDAEEIDKNFDQFVKLGLPEAFDIYSDPLTVNVNFGVERFEKFELSTEVEMLNFPEDSSVYPTNPEIVVKFIVQKSLREDFFADDFKIIVDYSLINQVDSTAPAIVVFHPENALEIETIPDSLSITYAK